MNEWLIANLGMSFIQLGTILGSVFLNIYLIKDRISARTNALKDATIKSLETSLSAERACLAKVQSEREEAKRDNHKQRIELESKSGEIVSLHSQISDLEKLMTDRPSLISWGSTMYREAFPENPDDYRTHKFYCAACWNVKRLVVPVERENGSTFVCKNFCHPWHREYRNDSRL